jgi:CBS domain containing-hemolysin-like protein
MMPAWIMLFFFGVLLSAFFSGSETGFYRLNRVRLVLDSRGGDPIARCLLYLTNNPSLFVATTLIGNNLANYVTSLAIVWIAQAVFAPRAQVAELLAPIVLSPVLFVYGELLPKNLFFHAPYSLVRRGGPLFLFCGIVFAPVSAFLWALGRLLRYLLGESPERVRLTLARKELSQVLEEGQEVGIVSPAQCLLAQHLFAVANRPVTAVCTPPARFASVTAGTRVAAVLQLARRRNTPLVLVQQDRKPVSYVRVVDLMLQEQPTVVTGRPLMEVSHTDTHLAALMKMQTAHEMIARVANERHETLGLVTLRQLTERLLRT